MSGVQHFYHPHRLVFKSQKAILGALLLQLLLIILPSSTITLQQHYGNIKLLCAIEHYHELNAVLKYGAHKGPFDSYLGLPIPDKTEIGGTPPSPRKFVNMVLIYTSAPLSL